MWTGQYLAQMLRALSIMCYTISSGHVRLFVMGVLGSLNEVQKMHFKGQTLFVALCFYIICYT